MRYLFTPAEWLSSINKQTKSAGEDVEKGKPFVPSVGLQTDAATVRSNVKIPQKMDLPFDPVIPLLGIYPKGPKTLIQKNISTPMFIAALFTIAKKWKQPICPSVDG